MGVVYLVAYLLLYAAGYRCMKLTEELVDDAPGQELPGSMHTDKNPAGRRGRRQGVWVRAGG